MGYRLILETGFDAPERVTAAVADYRQDTDVIGIFLAECTVEREKARTATPELYAHYFRWTAENGYKPLNNRNFVGELRRRRDVRKDSHSNVVVGLAIA